MATPPLKIKGPAGGRRNPFQVLMISVETALQKQNSDLDSRRELTGSFRRRGFSRHSAYLWF